MGYTLDLYKSLLFKELYGENYAERILSGDLPPVDDARMQEAIKRVLKKLDDMGPNLKDTKKAFKRFLRGSNGRDVYKKFGYGKGADDRYAAGHSVQQFKKNREAFMKMAVQPLVRQEIEWVGAVKRLDIPKNKMKTLCARNDRWTRYLIRTDGSPESLAHNEKVAALLGFCYGDMTKEEFKAFRRKHYEDLLQKGTLDKSQKEIEDILENEANNAAEQILNITRSELNDVDKEADQLPGIAYDILSGNVDKPEKGQSLESCYKAVGNRKISLSWVPDDVYWLMKSFGLPDDKNLPYEECMKWQDTGAKEAYQMLGELTANPYYTFIDPYKVYKYSEGQVRAPQEAQRPDIILKDGFLDKANSIYNVIIGLQSSGFLKKYAIGSGDAREDGKIGQFRIYQKTDEDENGHRIERTAILKVQEMENGQPVCVTETNPEDIVNEGLERERNAMSQRISRWSKENRTSEQFEGMRDALMAFNEIQLAGDDAHRITFKLYRKMQRSLEELEKAANVYLEKKTGERERRGRFKSSYERERVEFATKVKEFAGRKKRELEFAKKFEETRQLAAQAALDMAEVAEKNEDKQYAKLSGLEYRIAKGKEAKKAAKEQERKDAINKRKREAEEEKKANTARGGEYRKQLDELKKKAGNQPLDKDDDKAQNTLNAYIDARWKGYNEAGDDREKAITEAKKFLAAMTIDEYLLLESAQEKNPEDWSMHELINAGKIEELTDFVMHTDYFNKRFADEEKLLKKSTMESYRVNAGDCYRSSKHIMQCLDLASEANMNKEEEVNNIVEIRNVEEIKEELDEEGKEAAPLAFVPPVEPENEVKEEAQPVKERLSYNDLLAAKKAEDGKDETTIKRSKTMTAVSKKKTSVNERHNENQNHNQNKDAQMAPQALGGKGPGIKRKHNNPTE